MATTRLTDVVVPEEFTSYIVQNTMEKTALVEAGVAVRNGEIEAQLIAGADAFTVPNWFDLGNEEADIVSDDPAVDSTPRKLVAGRQVIRKSFLHNSWSAMNLASELAGDDAIARIRERAAAYWTRQLQRRLVASLNGILADNLRTMRATWSMARQQPPSTPQQSSTQRQRWAIRCATCRQWRCTAMSTRKHCAMT